MADVRPVSWTEFAQFAKRLQGLPVSRSLAGSSAGSIFTMDFGQTLAGDEDHGEYWLMMFCAWRMTRAGRMITCWHADANTALASALRQLEGQKVVNQSLSTYGDLSIEFDGGHELHIWNDAPFEAGSDSWFLYQRGSGGYAVEHPDKFVFKAESAS